MQTHMGTSTTTWLILGGAALFGVVFLTMGLSSLLTHLRRLRTWRRGRAMVVDTEWRTSGDDSYEHWIMERVGADGRPHRCVSELGLSGGTLRRLPFEVDVLVHPSDEGRFVLAGGCRSGWGGLAFLAVGVICLAVAGGIAAVQLGWRPAALP